MSPLSEAAARADAETVRRLLSEGHSVDGETGEVDTPLRHVCLSDASDERRLEVARLLLDAGAKVRRACEGKATALHAAARRGPLALVELLIRRGALSWQNDEHGRIALDEAREGTAADKEAIVGLLDRPVIRDPRFREAVRSIQTGDVAGFERLLDAHPRLLTERAIEPDCYPPSYFSNPRLFWFIANNPTLMRTMPANIVAIAEAMIVRRAETADLDYALELVMTSSPAREQGHQLPLMRLLIKAGATATPGAIVMTLAHGELAPVEMLLENGLAMTAPIAAALDRDDRLADLLGTASPEDRQMALGLAVINRRFEAARLCLDAGADPNAPLPVHVHSSPLHQAVLHDDVELMKLLIDRGARTGTPDTLWNSTPLGWATSMKRQKAEAYLRAL